MFVIPTKSIGHLPASIFPHARERMAELGYGESYAQIFRVYEGGELVLPEIAEPLAPMFELVEADMPRAIYNATAAIRHETIVPGKQPRNVDLVPHRHDPILNLDRTREYVASDTLQTHFNYRLTQARPGEVIRFRRAKHVSAPNKTGKPIQRTWLHIVTSGKA